MTLTWFIAFLIILGTSCRSTEQAVSDRDHAIELLNQGDFEQAILKLEQLHANKPDSNEIKILLASAYSGSVGLNLVDAFPLFSAAIFRERRDLKGQSGINQNIDQSEDAIAFPKFEKRLIRFLDSIVDGFTIFLALPYTDPKNRNRLIEGLSLTQKIEPDSEYYTRGKYLSALIRLSLFFNLLKDSFNGIDFSKQVTSFDLICGFSPMIFSQNIQLSAKNLAEAIDDIVHIRKQGGQTVSDNFQKLENSARAMVAFYTSNNDAVAASDLAYKKMVDLYCE